MLQMIDPVINPTYVVSKSGESKESLFDTEAPIAAPLNSDAEDLKAKESSKGSTGEKTGEKTETK